LRTCTGRAWARTCGRRSPPASRGCRSRTPSAPRWSQVWCGAIGRSSARGSTRAVTRSGKRWPRRARKRR
jgi:hypothetical protein